MASILHVIQRFNLGGAFRSMLALAKYSKEQAGYSHRFVSLAKSDPRALSLITDSGSDFVENCSFSRLHRMMEEADITHIHWWNCPELNAFLSGNLPPCRLLGWFHVSGHAPPQRLNAELLTRLDLAVCCTPVTLGSPAILQLDKNTADEKVRVILDGADFSRLAVLTTTSLQKPNRNFTVGYVGTVHYQKLHPQFIEMSAAARLDNVTFLVCGEGDVERCKNDAQRLGVAKQVSFVGHVEEITSVLSSIDIFGYPLAADTYAAGELCLQEAMYMGLPVVVFPHGGVSALVEHNKTGLVVNSPHEYAEALRFLYDNPEERKRLGERAAKYARQHFGADNSAMQMNKLYGELLRTPKEGKKATETHRVFPWKRFVESLADRELEQIFYESANPSTSEQAFAADELIKQLSPVMKFGGIRPYRNYYSEDPMLRFWNGLCLWGDNFLNQALGELKTADGLSEIQSDQAFKPNLERIVPYISDLCKVKSR